MVIAIITYVTVGNVFGYCGFRVEVLYDLYEKRAWFFLFGVLQRVFV